MDHLNGLSDKQKEAVLCTEGPLLIVAGAGAGKTRVITHRILQIIKNGKAPEQILAITFTNKAAREMRERTLSLLTDRGTPFISTFHSLGLTIIKENSKRLGFKRTPTIYDRADSMRTVKEILKSVGTQDLEPRAILSVISRQKGNGMTPEEFGAKGENHRDTIFADIWQRYEEALTKDGALDFDDLLCRATNFLEDNADVRTRYQERWHYIHIDEYQDTNRIQAKLASLLLGETKNICAVGDIDQTIYGWRGADITNMLQFEKVFGGAKVILLEENYRSTKNILAAANDVISKNVFRREKNLYTKNQDGEILSLYQAFDETDEAMFITRKISEYVAAGKQPKDFAVLYRANFQSRAIEEALLTAEIPYQVLGTRFFERKEVKDTLSFIRAALQGNAVDIARVANTPPRGIGKVTLMKILLNKDSELTPAVREKVENFRSILLRIQEFALENKPSEIIKFVMHETGIEEELKADKLEGAERLENLRELVSLSTRYDPLPIGQGLEEFLDSAALASDQDELKEESNAVRLMTVHASKGLEFKVVFITGLEEGLFPYERDEDSDSDKEEERRLMYVAITRAKEKIFLSFASYRTIFGSKSATIPSQFLSDIPQHLIELEAPERLGRTIYLD